MWFGSAEPGRIRERRLGEADPTRFFGHHACESCLAAGHALSDADRRVVARLHGNALDQFVDGRLDVDRHHHGRRAGRRAAVAPSVDAHRELVGRFDATGLDGAKEHGKRHQLTHAGRWCQLISILLEKRCAGFRIHQDGARRLGRERAIRGSRNISRRDEEAGNQCRNSEPKAAFIQHAPCRDYGRPLRERSF